MASIRRRSSFTGLTNAMSANVDDPLGTNIKRRGMDAYYEEARKSDPNYMSGPLPDPQWEGFGQALAEQGVTRVGMDAGRPHGIADDPTQPGWEHAREPFGIASNNIAGPAEQLAHLSGKKRPMPETHEVFMAKLAKKYGARRV